MKTKIIICSVVAILFMTIVAGCSDCIAEEKDRAFESDGEEIQSFPDKVLIDKNWYDYLIYGHKESRASSHPSPTISTFERVLDHFACDSKTDLPRFCSMEIVDVTEDMWTNEAESSSNMTIFVNDKGLLCIDSNGDQYIVFRNEFAEAVVCNMKCVYFKYFIF